MKVKSVFNQWSILFLLLFSCTSFIDTSDIGEYTKTVKKEFVISPDGTTSISNKYGTVEIKSWNKERVKIDVTIVVKAQNENAAKNVFDRIDIAFSNGNDFVKAVTDIQPRSKGWWPSNSKKNKIDYSINYEVFMPASNDLNLSHRYGEIFIERIEGTAIINSRYANMKVESLGDNSEINLAYGNGAIENAKDLDVDVSYGKLFIDKMEDAKISSKYTTIDVKESGNIVCSSKYDDYKLGDVGIFQNVGQYDNIEIDNASSVMVDTKYTKLSVDQISKTLQLDFKYGAANCRLAPSCSSALLEGNYTDFKLGLTPGLSTSIDASATYAGISYPNALDVSYEKEKGNEHELKGNLGNNQGQGEIKAKLSYGSLKIIMVE